MGPRTQPTIAYTGFKFLQFHTKHQVIVLSLSENQIGMFSHLHTISGCKEQDIIHLSKYCYVLLVYQTIYGIYIKIGFIVKNEQDEN